MIYRVEAMTQEELDDLRHRAEEWEGMYKRLRDTTRFEIRWALVTTLGTVFIAIVGGVVLQIQSHRNVQDVQNHCNKELKRLGKELDLAKEQELRAYRILTGKEIGPCWGQWELGVQALP
jgi:hypothetical protein